MKVYALSKKVYYDESVMFDIIECGSRKKIDKVFNEEKMALKNMCKDKYIDIKTENKDCIWVDSGDEQTILLIEEFDYDE